MNTAYTRHMLVILAALVAVALFSPRRVGAQETTDTIAIETETATAYLPPPKVRKVKVVKYKKIKPPMVRQGFLFGFSFEVAGTYADSGAFGCTSPSFSAPGGGARLELGYSSNVGALVFDWGFVAGDVQEHAFMVMDFDMAARLFFLKRMYVQAGIGGRLATADRYADGWEYDYDYEKEQISTGYFIVTVGGGLELVSSSSFALDLFFRYGFAPEEDNSLNTFSTGIGLRWY